jgi:hypothetical protein
VAWKERSRSLHLKGDATIAPVPSSALSHHVSSLHLVKNAHFVAPLTLRTLQRLRSGPQLTALQLGFSHEHDVKGFMAGVPPYNAASALRAVLPMHLRSFSVVAGSKFNLLDEQSAVLLSSFWAAATGMPHLTELHIEQHSKYMHARSDLAQLPHLRKLTFGPAGQRREHVEAMKQISQLRELTLLEDRPNRIRLISAPPHALQLESLALPFIRVDEETMRALSYLPTLTALHPLSFLSAAWPLLPQLPLLRHLSFSSYGSPTPAQLPSLCAAFSHCSALVDLTLAQMSLKAAEGGELTAEEERAAWAAVLSSVPHLRRLSVDGSMDSLLSVLPFHLPLLEHLVLTLKGGGFLDVDSFASLAHPNVRLLEVGGSNKRTDSDEQLRTCLHNNKHFPKLERCIHAQPAGSRLVACLVRALQGDEISMLDGPPRL